MEKLTLEQLRALRDQKKSEIQKRITDGKNIQIIIGMGTCGIAAGAKDTLNAFVDELEKRGVTNAVVKQTGCMGSCNSEPTVEVIMPEMPTVVYGKVDGEVARKIVSKHILNKSLLTNHIYDKPAADIIDK